tara:strand:- start:1068 stop:1247 length:180 start_codon:yes stop_codon:yes gene_type:complete
MIRIEATEQELKDAGIVTDEQIKKDKIALEAEISASNIKFTKRRNDAEDRAEQKRNEDL